MPYVPTVAPSWWLLVLTDHPDAASAVEAKYGPAAAESYRRSAARRAWPA